MGRRRQIPLVRKKRGGLQIDPPRQRSRRRRPPRGHGAGESANSGSTTNAQDGAAAASRHPAPPALNSRQCGAPRPARTSLLPRKPAGLRWCGSPVGGRCARRKKPIYTLSHKLGARPPRNTALRRRFSCCSAAAARWRGGLRAVKIPAPRSSRTSSAGSAGGRVNTK